VNSCRHESSSVESGSSSYCFEKTFLTASFLGPNISAAECNVERWAYFHDLEREKAAAAATGAACVVDYSCSSSSWRTSSPWRDVCAHEEQIVSGFFSSDMSRKLWSLPALYTGPCCHRHSSCRHDWARVLPWGLEMSVREYALHALMIWSSAFLIATPAACCRSPTFFHVAVRRRMYIMTRKPKFPEAMIFDLLQLKAAPPRS
jgi:hypothetical protein